VPALTVALLSGFAPMAPGRASLMLRRAGLFQS
jgi:hypothetical protein